MRHTLIIIFLIIGICGIAQKEEREYRISLEEVPAASSNFIKEFEGVKKVRWYREEDGRGNTTIEAKFKQVQKKYSIEFSKDGTLEDIERKIRWKNIPREVRFKIENVFKSRFNKYKITKIQEQFVGVPEVLFKVLKDGTEAPTNYEIIIKGYTEDQKLVYEFLFTAQGDFVRQVTVLQRNTDNLEF